MLHNHWPPPVVTTHINTGAIWLKGANQWRSSEDKHIHQYQVIKAAVMDVC